MKKLTLFLVAMLFSALSFAALNPYAYGLSSSLDGTTLTVNYSLNASATAVSVVIIYRNLRIIALYAEIDEGAGGLSDPVALHLLDAFSPGEIIEVIRQTCALILPLYALSGGMNALAGTLRGMGVSITNMLVSLIGVCGFRILWVVTAFKAPILHSLPGVYLAWPVSWMIVITALLGFFIYHIAKLKRRIEGESKT